VISGKLPTSSLPTGHRIDCELHLAPCESPDGRRIAVRLDRQSRHLDLLEFCAD
jgi:hypothetical protein